MKEKNEKKYKAPRKDEKRDWKVTPVMLAETYDERLSEEKKETLTATVLAETFPEVLNYKTPWEKESRDGNYEEE